MASYEWLGEKHPIYLDNESMWKRMERRFYGGEPVLAELREFDWEVRQRAELGVTDERQIQALREAGWFANEQDHFFLRQRQSVYINFGDLFSRTIVGHLMRKRPTPEEGLDFGTLGEISTEDDGEPSQAELIYYNADGVGNDGSQWDNFWGSAARHAMVTGHRWIMVESPVMAPETRADELAGARPYLVEYGPIDVTNWFISDGHLQWAVIVYFERNPRIEKGKMEGNTPEKRYLLMTREGYAGLGDEFSKGGWFRFDADQKPLWEQVSTRDEDDEVEPSEAMGNWESTDGDIPMFPLFYERAKSTPEHAAMSRSGTVEISQAAIAYMNLSSAADFDVWDAAQSMQFILGVDVEGYNLAIAKMKEGHKTIPFPINKKTGNPPEIYDGSTGAVVAGAFETRLSRKMDEARELAALEATSVPDSSGASKQAGFADVRAPRLALMASELEQAQNTAIRFLEMRFGNKSPTGKVEWLREFELTPLIDSIRELFEIQVLAGVESPTLTTRAMMAVVRSKGLATDDKVETQIETELQDSAAAAVAEKTQASQQQAEEREVESIITGALAAEEAGGAPNLTLEVP